MENENTLRKTIDKYSNVARFAKCLGISRPSMYKYIDCYDNGDKSCIPDDVLKKFNTLMEGNDDFKLLYCNDLFSDYLNNNESTSEPVPKEIAAKIDSLELTIEDVDEWIEHTENLKNELEAHIQKYGLNKENYRNDIADYEKRLKDLEYTRELVELRKQERHFINVKEGKMEWKASTGLTIIDQSLYNKTELEYKPELEEAFKYCKAKIEDGYMFYFAGAFEDDTIVVNVVTNAGWNEGIKTRIASFSPDKGQFFVKIPKIFDDAHEYAFNYEVERLRGDKLLNHVEGFFQR